MNRSFWFSAPGPPPVPPIRDLTDRHTEPRLLPIATYTGEPQLCRSFLAECSLFSVLQPSAFPTEQSKVLDIAVAGREAPCVLSELRQCN